MVPAGFFGAGSDPIDSITLEGVPLEPADVFDEADTVVRRLADAILPACPSSDDTIPIEIVVLSLKSVDPVTVTFNGQNPELWDVDVCLAPNQGVGSMTIRCDTEHSGTYEAWLPVQVSLTFTRDQARRGPLDLPTDMLHIPEACWVDASSNFGITVPPGTEVDSDCDGTPDLMLDEGTTNFFAGVCPADPNAAQGPVPVEDQCQVVKVNKELMATFASGRHNVRIPGLTDATCCKTNEDKPMCSKLTLRCEGGGSDGQPCELNMGDCPGGTCTDRSDDAFGCLGKRCVGGDRNGKLCASDNNCPGGGTCTGEPNGVLIAGDGASCESGETGACCLPDWSCVEDSNKCCCELVNGGEYLGNGNNSCEPEFGCCLPDGSCITTQQECCKKAMGTIVTQCAGADADGNNVDDACECIPDCTKENVECLTGPQYDNRKPVGRVLSENLLCTGWIIAGPNCIITNRHCITTNGSQFGPLVSDMTTRSIEFNFECEACTSGPCKQVDEYQVVELIHENQSLDYAILRVQGNPAAQWGVAKIDPNPPVIGEGIYEIHHAGGLKKGFDEGVVTAHNVPGNCIPGTAEEVDITAVAAGGASGAPVFRTSNDAVMALCHCGPNCAPGSSIPMSAILPDALELIQIAGCDPIVIDPPEEACCLQDETCVDITPGDCAGTSRGPDTTCAETSCAKEACCSSFFANDGCGDAFPDDCVVSPFFGTPQGPRTACLEACILGASVQACCMPDGSCDDSAPVCCADAGGVPAGPAVCPPPACDDQNGNGVADACEQVGACCNGATGGCSDGILPGNCVPPLKWTEATECVNLRPLCGEPVGACCTPEGLCFDDFEQVSCELHGTFLGKDTTCAGDGCPDFRLFFVRAGDDPRAHPPGPTTLIASAGGIVSVEMFVENSPVLVRGVGADFPCTTAGGDSGSVAYLIDSGSVDPFRADYIHFEQPSLGQVDQSLCPDGDVRFAVALNLAGGSETTPPKYFGGFDLAVSSEADGTFTLDFDPATTALVDADGAEIPGLIRERLIIIVGPCGINADCDDGDICTFDLCIEGQCSNEAALYGDVASSGGVCGPDGQIALADILAMSGRLRG